MKSVERNKLKNLIAKIIAHQYSIFNEEELKRSKICGCFHCKAIFPNLTIKHWIEEGKSRTAWCPKCKMDTVIGSASGFPINKSFLTMVKRYWFRGK